MGECISLSGSQGRFKDRLKSWWRGEDWMTTHWYLADPRYNHVSWKVPGGVVLFGGAGGWRSAELVKDGQPSGQELFRLNYNLMWVHFFLFPILCSLIFIFYSGMHVLYQMRRQNLSSLLVVTNHRGQSIDTTSRGWWRSFQT